MLESLASQFQRHGLSPQSSKAPSPERHYDLSGPECGFHWAVFAGDEALVRRGLAAGAPGSVVNRATPRDGASPLHVAALTPHAAVARLLLEHGADVAAVDRRAGSTPLHVAALHGQAQLVALLVEAGADPAARDAHNETPFFAAHRMRHRPVLKVLSQAGGSSSSSSSTKDPAPQPNKNRQLDLLASFAGSVGAGLKAVSSAPAASSASSIPSSISSSSSSSAPVLKKEPLTDDEWEAALRSGDAGRVAGLVASHGAALLERRDARGLTAAHRLAALGNVAALERCLELGAAPGATDASGRTPLHWAAISGKDAAAACLVRSLGSCGGGLVSAADDEGRSALHYAAAFGLADVAACLVEAGADVARRDAAGKTPWDWANDSDNDGGGDRRTILAMLQPAAEEQGEGEGDEDEEVQDEDEAPGSDGLQPLQMSLRRGASFRSEPPGIFICPITQDLMQDPVVAADGNTYDREAIEGWYRRSLTSPLTNMPVESALIPNRMLRSEIIGWVERNAA